MECPAARSSMIRGRAASLAGRGLRPGPGRRRRSPGPRRGSPAPPTAATRGCSRTGRRPRRRAAPRPGKRAVPHTGGAPGGRVHEELPAGPGRLHRCWGRYRCLLNIISRSDRGAEVNDPPGSITHIIVTTVLSAGPGQPQTLDLLTSDLDITQRNQPRTQDQFEDDHLRLLLTEGLSRRRPRAAAARRRSVTQCENRR